jgi:hypothetical protein
MFWVAQVVIVSFIIIFLLHNLYFFFKETLTVPKMKDLVKRPQQKYDALFRELRMHREETSTVNNTNDNNINESMKSELKRYLMELNAPQQQQLQQQPQQQQQLQQPPQQQQPQQPPYPQSSQSNFMELSNY